eukprot:gnl/TRDRNA2_/TRDRNA2_191890_c0_seq1.p1 gnl/TRDRNA2_/TRDRNA2_191890_c0~~gnl/TRDRNA2_/TRDRNA2_191890_c0_seq1.p1  ORF type:complete len:396 (-),score=34.04 gnl/TRDRNA2_/TRDRNA2_191890_c0_seq1:26-1213(-)
MGGSTDPPPAVLRRNDSFFSSQMQDFFCESREQEPKRQRTPKRQEADWRVNLAAPGRGESSQEVYTYAPLAARMRETTPVRRRVTHAGHLHASETIQSPLLLLNLPESQLSQSVRRVVPPMEAEDAMAKTMPSPAIVSRVLHPSVVAARPQFVAASSSTPNVPEQAPMYAAPARLQEPQRQQSPLRGRVAEVREVRRRSISPLRLRSVSPIRQRAYPEGTTVSSVTVYPAQALPESAVRQPVLMTQVAACPSPRSLNTEPARASRSGYTFAGTFGGVSSEMQELCFTSRTSLLASRPHGGYNGMSTPPVLPHQPPPLPESRSRLHISGLASGERPQLSYVAAPTPQLSFVAPRSESMRVAPPSERPQKTPYVAPPCEQPKVASYVAPPLVGVMDS